MTKEVQVYNRQTIEDVALQHYGGVEGVEWLISDNRDMLTDGFNTRLYTGMSLRIRKDTYINQEVVTDMLRENIVPATDDYTAPITGPDHNNDYNPDHH